MLFKTLQHIIVFLLTTLVMSCNSVNTREERDIDCKDKTASFNETYFTIHKIFYVDSILVEQYVKGSNYSNLVHRGYNILTTRTNDKPDGTGLEWVFTLNHPLDTQYDYRFFIPEGKTIFKYDLSNLSLRQVVVGKILLKDAPDDHKAHYTCILGSYKLNGVQFSGGNIDFK